MIKEADLSIETYINDVIDWGFLILNDIRFKKLVVIGHSEGALIGMIAAKELVLSKYVSISGTALTADSIIAKQVQDQPKEIKDEVSRVFKQLKMGKTVDNVKPVLYNLFRPSVQPYLISWIKYNPTTELAKLNIPILIIQGTSDIQTSIDDANLLHQSTSNSKLVIIDEMNHVLKHSVIDKDENVATYSNPTLKNIPALAVTLASFITQKD